MSHARSKPARDRINGRRSNAFQAISKSQSFPASARDCDVKTAQNCKVAQAPFGQHSQAVLRPSDVMLMLWARTHVVDR